MTGVFLRATDLIAYDPGLVTEEGGVSEVTLQDGLDGTYVLFNGVCNAAWSLGSFTLGTGRIKSIVLNVRAQSSYLSTFNVRTYGPLDVHLGSLSMGSGVTVYSTAPWVPPVLTQAQVDDLGVRLDHTSLYLGYIHELSVAVVIAAAPTANVTYPTGTPTVGLSSPTVTWQHTPGSDGGPQSYYEIKVFDDAQYGAGGFDPDTSTSDWTSGQVAGSANSATVGPLGNNDTYRVYIRTAQTINSVAHWSAWDFEQFTVDFDPATVSSVTPVATNPSGLMTVTIARNTGTEAWVSVELERSDDAGVTFVPVRGATGVTETNQHVTTWSANSVVVRDYEAPNGVAVTYRARATTATGVVGAWVSSSSTTWTSPTGLPWLKDPHNPTLNIELRVREQPQPNTDVVSGIFQVVGAKNPVIITDTRTGGSGTFVVQTATKAEGLAFTAATAGANQFKLLQFPATHLWGSKYVHLGPAQEMYIFANVDKGWRTWQIAYTEIDRPADETDY